MSEQLTLPYEIIDKVAGRSFLRENFKQSGRASFFITLNKIFVRDGFNQRRIFDDIEELAMSMFVNGQEEPLVLDILEDGTARVDEGERRFRAFHWLFNKNMIAEDHLVEFYPNKASVSEFDRMLRQHTSNNFKKKFKPIETAGVVFNLKHNFGEITNEKLGEYMGCSRQQIDNYLILASASDDIKNQIIVQDLGFKQSLDLIKNEKKLQEQGSRDEKKHAQTSLSIPPDKKDVNAEDIAASKLLEEQIPGEDDLPFDITDQDEIDDVRTTNNISHENEESGRPLSLVGNTVADKSGKKEDDGSVKWDESRPEIAAIQNCIKLSDKIEAVVNKLDVPEGTKTDLQNYVKWMHKDLDISREYIHKHKDQNKRGR